MSKFIASLMLTISCTASASSGMNVTGVTATDEYYKGIDMSAKDDELKQSLQKLISQRTTVSYDKAWDAFDVIDQYLPVAPGRSACPSGTIADIYSTTCWTSQKELGGECGTYKKEGDCFNREHSWPKSWWGGFSKGAGAQSDLFELYPSDGYVNGLRGNLPFGNVKAGTERYTSTNGCVIGECSDDTGDYTGECFEVADYMKGDLSRTYFYLSTMFDGVWECCDEPAVSEAKIKSWEEVILRSWHAKDPVDSMELKRNDIIFEQFQHNRNPFIDHPEWVDQISDF
ncbi:hypothetical protein TrCOL_g9120 [Triparma columacea]|uniref:Uncharacterized protein n=1 Tax=Triparma columacea TaxID=722753 RepID=A0A9W7LAE7_9STRA|nr:hypothetical protein TrCOL_g9120 [Triparma columacea]